MPDEAYSGMDETQKLKSLLWVGSSKKDLKAFPAEVRSGMGFALYQAQLKRFALAFALSVLIDIEARASFLVQTHVQFAVCSRGPSYL